MQTIPVDAAMSVRCSFDDHARLCDAMLEYNTYLHRVAHSILHHTEDAEDAVQAAYLSAWVSWAGFRNQSSLKTWLTTIVMNKALTELRTKRRRTWMSMDEDPALLTEAECLLSFRQRTPEQHVMREQTTQHVQELLARLPKQAQEIVALRYLQELSVEEIARARGTTHGAVKGHLHRGCNAIRKGARVLPKRQSGMAMLSL